MKKYIKYTESNGKEVNKEYSDEEVVRGITATARDSKQKPYANGRNVWP